MINIISVTTELNDKRSITAIRIKVKDDSMETPQFLVATVSAAFYKMTLLTDEGISLRTALDPKRRDVVNLTIRLKKNSLKHDDIAKFTDAFQEAIDTTKLI